MSLLNKNCKKDRFDLYDSDKDNDEMGYNIKLSEKDALTKRPLQYKDNLILLGRKNI